MNPGSLREAIALGRSEGLACARALIGELVRVRDLADDLRDQAHQGDDLKQTRTSASDLASRLLDLALFCREHAAELGCLQDLSSESGLVKDVANAIGAVMAGPFAAVNPAVDYDLYRAALAARQLAGELDGARAAAASWPQIRVGTPRLVPVQPPPQHHHEQQEQLPSMRIAPSAGRLLTVASQLLPPSDRGRYAEEFGSELWELASAGAGRGQQLRYATRQAIRAGQLRGEVLAPRRKRAVP